MDAITNIFSTDEPKKNENDEDADEDESTKDKEQEISSDGEAADDDAENDGDVVQDLINEIDEIKLLVTKSLSEIESKTKTLKQTIPGLFKEKEKEISELKKKLDEIKKGDLVKLLDDINNERLLEPQKKKKSMSGGYQYRKTIRKRRRAGKKQVSSLKGVKRFSNQEIKN